MPVDSGVPQGSVVGLCLFLLYINDLPIDIESKIQLFADDTLCSNTIKHKEDQKKLPVECHPRKKIVLSYHLHGHNLQNVSTAKYLGINIQDNLNWGLHIDTISNKSEQDTWFSQKKPKNRKQENQRNSI